MYSGHDCSRYRQHCIFLPVKLSRELTTSLVNVTFEHYLLGGSLLWASVVVLTVASLLSLRPPRGPASARNTLPLAAMALSILGLCLNGVAAVACAGAVAGFAIVRNWHWRALAFAAAGAALFFFFRHLTGVHHVSGETEKRMLVTWTARAMQAALAAGGLLLSFRILCILTFAWAAHRNENGPRDLLSLPCWPVYCTRSRAISAYHSRRAAGRICRGSGGDDHAHSGGEPGFPSLDLGNGRAVLQTLRPVRGRACGFAHPAGLVSVCAPSNGGRHLRQLRVAPVDVAPGRRRLLARRFSPHWKWQAAADAPGGARRTRGCLSVGSVADQLELRLGRAGQYRRIGRRTRPKP